MIIAAVKAITLASIIQGAIVGAIMGAGLAAITGGNIAQGAITGAIGGAFFGATGDILASKAFEGLGNAGKAVAHAMSGGLSGGIGSVATGGDFGSGAAIGAASAGAAKYLGGTSLLKTNTAKSLKQFSANAVRRAVIGATIGGGVAEASGGNFADGASSGAISGAVGYAANDSMHDGGFLNDWIDKIKSGQFIGTGIGGEATNFYAVKYQESGNPLWVVPGLFSALWTPETYVGTISTLFGGHGFRNAGRVWYLRDGTSARTLVDYGNFLRIERHMIGKARFNNRAMKWHLDAFWGEVRHWPHNF